MPQKTTTDSLLSAEALEARLEAPRYILASAAAKLHTLGEHYAATQKAITANVLLSPEERDAQLAAAAQATRDRLEAISHGGLMAVDAIQGALAQSRRDVAHARLPLSRDALLCAAAWERAWAELTRLNASEWQRSETEIVQQLAAGADPAMLAALWRGIPLWCQAHYAASPDEAQSRADELLALADTVARRTVFGEVTGTADAIEQALPAQMRAVDLAIDEVAAALAVAQQASGKR